MNDIKKTLKIASTLEIALGALHLLSLMFLLEKELLNALTPIGKCLLFGVDGLLILLGVIGLLKKTRKIIIGYHTWNTCSNYSSTTSICSNV